MRNSLDRYSPDKLGSAAWCDVVVRCRADLARVDVKAYREAEALGWHFDRSEFTTTLLLQVPEEGGDFVYRIDHRSVDAQNHDGVAELLRAPALTLGSRCR